MDKTPDIGALSLSMLPSSSKRLLSDLLNSTKVIPTEGPIKLPRDWRGLACLANLTAEVEASIQNCSDKTARVLEIWVRDSTVTIGQLLSGLQKLDRYDAYEDLCSDMLKHFSNKELTVAEPENVTQPEQSIVVPDDPEILTYDDRPGYKQFYHAYVLYAEEDKDFVEELKRQMWNEGFQIATKDKLLPGFTTHYAPITKLISERCVRIILVYSPDFIKSPAISFYRDRAHAFNVESQTKSIPIMYRQCQSQLPGHVSFYHMLQYSTSLYDFWKKLATTLDVGILPRLNGIQPAPPPQIISRSTVNITELPLSDRLCIQGRQSPDRSGSMGDVSASAYDRGSLSDESQSREDGNKTTGLMNGLLKTNSLERSGSSASACMDRLDVPPSTEDRRSLSAASHSSEERKKKNGLLKKLCKKFTGSKGKKVTSVHG